MSSGGRARRCARARVMSGTARKAGSIAPSRHEMSRAVVSEELFDRTMKDYAQPITARQLVDVVAYLRNPRVQSERAPRPSQ